MGQPGVRSGNTVIFFNGNVADVELQELADKFLSLKETKEYTAEELGMEEVVYDSDSMQILYTVNVSMLRSA